MNATATATATTFPCATWTRAGRACGKPATEAMLRRDQEPPYEPICSFHLKIRNRSWQVASIEISGDVAAALVADRAARQAAKEVAAEAKAAEQRKAAAANTVRLWAEADAEWQVVYAPEKRDDWSLYAAARDAGLTGEALEEASTRLQPRWFVQPRPEQNERAGYDRWEITVTQDAGRPAFVEVRRAGNATAAGAAALAEALIAAAAVAAGMTAAAKGGAH